MKLMLDEEIEDGTVSKCGYSMLTNGSRDFYLFESIEDAGEQARKYWEDMAQDDAEEFACVVGTDTLVQWGLGQSAGPGSTAVNSLDEWLDLWLITPEEHWASYDGVEIDVTLPMLGDMYEDCPLQLKDLVPGEDSANAGLEDGAQSIDESPDDLDEVIVADLSALWTEQVEAIDELGFTPGVAYRHN